MGFGGGTWLTQNKVLPGTYINYISATKYATALSDRGVIAFPTVLSWGKTGIITIKNSDFQSKAKAIFGFSYDSAELSDFRELFCNAVKVIAYNMNSGDKAANTFAEAKYPGTRGNDLKIVIAKNIDDEDLWDVSTYLDNERIETQTVADSSSLVANDYVTFKEATLVATAGSALSGGTNGTQTGDNHSTALAALGAYTFNALACTSSTAAIISLYIAFTRRMREEVGVKFQTVVLNTAADYEGIVSVKHANEIPWVTGAIGSVAINKSLSCSKYTGEREITVEDDPTESVQGGYFVFTKDENDDVCVVEDFNTLVTATEEKNPADFRENQVIRVIDQDAIETAKVFATTFRGKVVNDADGRVSLKSALCNISETMQNIHAIENFSRDDVTVEPGETKRAVLVTKGITPVVAMKQLYVATYVS